MTHFRTKYYFMQSFRFLPMIVLCFYILLFLISVLITDTPKFISILELIISPYFILAFLIGLFFITFHKGYEFNKKKKKWKKYIYILGLRIGKWIDLPKFDYFLISRSSTNHSVNFRVQSYGVFGANSFLYGCKSSDDNSENDFAMLLANRDCSKNCITIALKLNEIYNIKIFDSTGRETIEINNNVS